MLSCGISSAGLGSDFPFTFSISNVAVAISTFEVPLLFLYLGLAVRTVENCAVTWKLTSSLKAHVLGTTN